MEGNVLHEQCQASDAKYLECIAFIVGVSDAMQLSQHAVHKGARACLPTNATSGQLAEVVRLYLERNPQERHLRGPNRCGNCHIIPILNPVPYKTICRLRMTAPNAIKPHSS
jgi:hypothetical protein